MCLVNNERKMANRRHSLGDEVDLVAKQAKIVSFKDEEKYKHVLRFVHPSTMMVAGPTGSGKTQFVSKLLMEKMFSPEPERIIWVYAQWQPAYDLLQSQIPMIEFINGLPPNFLGTLSPLVRNLVVLDDQMAEVGGSKDLAQLFTQGSHHRNLTILYLVQNLFDQAKSMRTVSLNSQYLVLFKSPRDATQISTLGRQMFPHKSAFLPMAFEDATTLPHSYLLLDLRPETDKRFQVRTRIFPSETPTIVYCPVGI